MGFKSFYFNEEQCVYAGVDEELEFELDGEGNSIEERLVKKTLVRNGKKVIKMVTDKPGFKIVKDGNKVKEVKMDAKEKKSREKGQKAGARKRKATSKASSKKRSKSNKKRDSIGLDRSDKGSKE